MTVGVLIITHGNIGSSLLDTTNDMLGSCPLQLKILRVTRASHPDALRQQTKEMINCLNTGQGVLILTDMYGSTPSNIACYAADEQQVRVVTGLNLPMLIRVLNYPFLSLTKLAEKAISGGREGVYTCLTTNEGTE
ncbi:PTS sugar transporter subunit IIA [Nitrosococcus oceani]|uniref:PTS system fructose subfamily IIA component n=2 Tax=Nitrosococcus oceani TaxID=1229 RepID=Q3J7F1_NITOC|nr:PTS mannose transporter subunit IIA [Nitrosococcus oceani]KFI18273.1 PTS fructose transporter subunit IIA [Nitrosococcus oceani C-27]ABA59245.1 PTS system fructose subfamily IIA component [Nitrosococcus oceani ATCC 19707]EDZ66293.1 PTS system fructose IIA component, putative [Nitrosococcus oceani AFC27]KFI21451.1 PTS fructose transporter subunit IIA [Nitrosococcus oceani]GEM21070.1 PTS mannose transporter subunit IIA [Nitrosococcus oceani]